jgi:hypothetical protein
VSAAKIPEGPDPTMMTLYLFLILLSFPSDFGI